MKSLIALTFVAILATTTGAIAATVTPDFTGGEISDEVDEKGDKTGKKLFKSNTITLDKEVELENGKSLTIDTIFKDKDLFGKDIFKSAKLSGDKDESIHITVNGNVFKFSFVLRYLDEGGKYKNFGSGIVNLAKGAKSASVVKNVKASGKDNGVIDIRAYRLLILNNDPTPMKIKSVMIGVDAETITYLAAPEVVPVPLPASGLLLFAGIGALATRRKTHLLSRMAAP